MVSQAFRVAEALAGRGITAGIIDIYRLKPVNEEKLLALIGQSKKLVTLEEHTIVGGLGSAISEILTDNGKLLPLKRIALNIKDCAGYGDRQWMHEFFGLDVDGILKQIPDI